MMIISGLLGIHIPTTKALRAVMLLAVALGAGAAFGQGKTLWQDGGVQLCGPSAAGDPVATSDGAGGAIVVWNDSRTGPPIYSIYAQRVDAAGVPQWAKDGVALLDSTWENPFGVIDDGEHGAIVGWSRYYSPLLLQRVSAEGVPLWGPNGLMLRPPSDSVAECPAFVRDGHRGAIVVWNTYSLHFEVDTLIACRVDSGGVKRWETVVRIDTLGDTPPSVCSDGLSGVIIAWREYDGHAGDEVVRVQRVDSAGAIRWDLAGVAACTLSSLQGMRGCAAVGESRFAVGMYVRGDDSWQNRVQMFDMDGDRLWEPAAAPVSPEYSSSAGAVGLPVGNACQSIWVWMEDRVGTYDLLAQKLDSTGNRRWDSAGVWLGTSDTSDFRGFSAAADGRGGTIAAWALYRSRLNWDIYCQRVDFVGRLLWSDTGLAVCAGDNNVRYPVAVTDGDEGAIVAWKDGRGIYAQRVADGSGVAEAMNDGCRAMSTVRTVVRDVLFLPEAASRKPRAASLLDAAGRRVATLHKGANDVSELAPGVYFVSSPSVRGAARVVILN